MPTTLTEAVERACQEPTLLDALTWIAVWECERAIEQAYAFKLTGVSTAANGGWDTCFRSCFSAVMEAWAKKGKQDQDPKKLKMALEFLLNALVGEPASPGVTQAVTVARALLYGPEMDPRLTEKA
jgi:hypothetical protein